MKSKCLAPLLCLSTMIILSLTITSCSSIRVRRTTDQDPSTPSMVLNGYPFHAEAFGDPQNPVVIVLHGGPGADYRYLLPLTPLAEDYYLVMYDQRSSGLSPRQPAKEIGADSFIEDLDAFVTHFGNGQPVYLLGPFLGCDDRIRLCRDPPRKSEESGAH